MAFHWISFANHIGFHMDQPNPDGSATCCAASQGYLSAGRKQHFARLTGRRRVLYGRIRRVRYESDAADKQGAIVG